MLRKDKSIIFLLLLAFAVIIMTSGCKNFTNRLRANYYFRNGNAEFEDKHYRQAVKEYERAIEKNPNLAEAYRYLGESYKNLYKPHIDSEENDKIAQQALNNLKKAYEANPKKKDVIYSLADMYEKVDKIEEAEELYYKILDLDPTDLNNYYVLANFYKKYSGKNEDFRRKAESMYLRRIELDPASVEGYKFIEKFYKDLVNSVEDPSAMFDKAIKYDRLLIKMQPDNALNYYSKGVNLFWKAHRLRNILSREERLKLGAESEEALMKAMDMEPDYANTYSYINILYRNVFTALYPEKYDRYMAEADKWQEKFLELRKREQARAKLEEELSSEK